MRQPDTVDVLVKRIFKDRPAAPDTVAEASRKITP